MITLAFITSINTKSRQNPDLPFQFTTLALHNLDTTHHSLRHEAQGQNYPPIKNLNCVQNCVNPYFRIPNSSVLFFWPRITLDNSPALLEIVISTHACYLQLLGSGFLIICLFKKN